MPEPNEKRYRLQMTVECSPEGVDAVLRLFNTSLVQLIAQTGGAIVKEAEAKELK